MTNEFHTVIFTSRPKDNKDVAGFHARGEQHVARLEFATLGHLADVTVARFGDMFERFANAGVAGETSRLYVTLNGADSDRCLKELALEIMQDKVSSVTKVNAAVASLVARPDMSATKRWLFDADCDEKTARKFAKRVDEELAKRYGADSPLAKCYMFPSKSNFAVCTNARFDTRKLLAEFPDVELKKEASLFCMAITKARR